MSNKQLSSVEATDIRERIMGAFYARHPKALNAVQYDGVSFGSLTDQTKRMLRLALDQDAAALRTDVAATPVSQGRNQIAGFLLARDEDYAATPHLLAWAERLIAQGKDAQHDGDCTKKSYTCLRCTADRALADADRVIALAAAPQAQEPVAWRWKPKHATEWIYNPEAQWLAAQSLDTIDVEPLYTSDSRPIQQVPE